jgi:hypothetical protein
MQMQDRADFYDPQLQTLPMLFKHVSRMRGGRTESLAAADVRRDDQVVATQP